MGTRNFDSLDAQAITIRFNCEKCKALIEEELEWTPPDLSAERYRDATGYEESEIECSNCSANYGVSVTAELGGGSVDLHTNDEDHPFELIETFRPGYWEYIEDLERSAQELPTEEHLFEELNEIRSLLDLAIDERLYYNLLKQSYVHAVTIMESFLFELAFKKIQGNESMQEEFVKFHKSFQKNIKHSNIHFEMRTLITKIKEELVSIAYHNLPEISALYSTVLNIDIGDINELTTIVELRHDLVHRNGKNKQGELINLSQHIVIETIEKIESFMRRVNIESNRK